MAIQKTSISAEARLKLKQSEKAPAGRMTPETGKTQPGTSRERALNSSQSSSSSTAR